MTSEINIKKYIEYGLIVSVLSFLFGLIIFKAENLSPIFISSIAAASLFIYLGCRIKGAFILFYLLLGMTFLENNEGIEPIEIPFYIASVLLSAYILLEIVTGKIIIKNALDKLFILLIFLLPYAIILGILNGGSSYKALGEATNFFGVLAYFPLKKYLNEQAFRKVAYFIVFSFIFFVLVRNLIYYREILTQAILPWQTENARVAANEFILVMGACLFMSYAALSKSVLQWLLYTALFVLMIGGLLLTQSRGYWLAFIFGALLIFWIIERRGKFKILLTFVILSSATVLIATLFFYDLFGTVINALSARFQTLGSGKLDLSLHERFLESKTVVGLISSNPISGYGMGYTFTKKMLFYDNFVETSYVHNGYLATWFKFGIVGLITIISIWFLIIKNSIQLYKESSTFIHKVTSLTILGTVAGMFLVNNTSPQVLIFESILFISLFGAYLSSNPVKTEDSESSD